MTLVALISITDMMPISQIWPNPTLVPRWVSTTGHKYFQQQNCNLKCFQMLLHTSVAASIRSLSSIYLYYNGHGQSSYKCLHRWSSTLFNAKGWVIENVPSSFDPLWVLSELSLLKIFPKSKVGTVLNSWSPSFSKLSLHLIFDQISPEIIQMEHTMFQNKTHPLIPNFAHTLMTFMKFPSLHYQRRVVNFGHLFEPQKFKFNLILVCMRPEGWKQWPISNVNRSGQSLAGLYTAWINDFITKYFLPTKYFCFSGYTRFSHSHAPV